MAEDIAVITGCGFTVTETVNALPAQEEALGITV
jgi:hypothetical protein